MNLLSKVVQQDILLSNILKKTKESGCKITDNIRPLLKEVFILNNIVAKVLKRKLTPSEYDRILDISNKWDTIISYYNSGTGNLRLPFDKGQNVGVTDRKDRRRKFRGIVVKSGHMQKTVTVARERVIKHKPTGKYIKRKTKILVHDENEISRVGDIVIIAECRPVSKRKSHRLIKRVYV
jgi:small subunit ribosomal protein S17